MGSDEAPDTECHVVLRAGGGDDTHVDAVGEHEIDSSETSENARCEGVETDCNVVGHDEAGSLRFGGEDRVGPHLVVLDLVDHLRAEHGIHELRTRDRQQRSEERSAEEDGEGDGGVGKQTPEDPRIAFGEKVPDALEVQPVAGVDVIMSAADEAVQVCFEGAGAFVSSYGGEVGRGLTVEEPELAKIG